MSYFDDILKKPLPSQVHESYDGENDMDDFDQFLSESEEDEMDEFDRFLQESEDDDEYGDPSDDGNDDTEEGCEDECGPGYEDGEDDLDDLDDMDDDEIADSIEDIDDDLDLGIDDDDELDDALDDVDDDDDLDDDEDDEDAAPAPLEGEDDKKADEMMAIATTPILIRDELTAEEAVNFYESVDAEVAIEEGMLLESDMQDLYQEGVFASPNKPFKMTKKARFNQLYEMSVLIEGRMHNDPMYTKLQKAYKIERICKKQLRKKYHNLAIRRAKIYLKRLMKSKSGVLNKIGKKMGLKK
uniref:Uncharacterized protein n=1 Tax=Myoviridae sp. ctaOv25 TaxID=2827290 RepID=A0A8S5R6A4_9CAUD|nr:MAG TPA: hypothetical protein [Myoviridae sp. ctaOv25]